MKRRDLLTGAGLGLAAGGLPLPGTERPAQAAARKARPPIKDVARHQDEPRSGVILGGIGAGGAELRKNGRFYNWSAFNNEPRGSGPELGADVAQESVMFFKLRYQVAGQEPRIKLLQIENGNEVGSVPVHVYEFPWMSGVATVEYQARFPYADLTFRDPDMPVVVTLRAWSPFVPHDLEASSLPLMFFDFRVENISGKPVDVMLIGAQRNLVGYDVNEKLWRTELKDGAGYRMFEAGATAMAKDHGSAGTLALASLSPQSSSYLGWEHRHPYFERVLRSTALGDIDETAKRTRRDRKTGKRWALPRVFNSLARSETVAAKKSFSHGFVMAWNFPNFWNEKHDKNLGNYYNRRFATAGEVVRHAIENKADLERRTFGFLDAFYDSDADQFVLDQVNSQLTTFITSAICPREGQIGIIEGMTEHQKWGPVATTDVSVYGSVPIATLFPAGLRETLRAHRASQHKGGSISHGLRRDFVSEQQVFGEVGANIRLDLHPQYAGMVLRDYLWSGDKAVLEEFWPSIKKALEYCVTQRDRNGDSIPDMEGIMSSYDNFPMFGTASYIASQWLSALAGAVVAARDLGDAAAEKRYAGFLDKGKAIFEQALWNGQYYRLWNDEGGKHGGKDEGCLTDQLIGQWTMRFAGLGDLVPREHVATALRSIMKMSYKPAFGLRNCSWPDGVPWKDVPDDIWVDQANTCWSGVEVAFASFLIYEGLYKEGVDVIRTIDERYRKAGRYFDHQEFGGHYFRPMASFAVLHALLGLSINRGVYTFDPKLGATPGKPGRPSVRLFFATPTATGHYNRKGAAGPVSLEVATGKLEIKALRLGMGKPTGKEALVLDGKPIAAAASTDAGLVVLTPASPLVASAGQILQARPRG